MQRTLSAAYRFVIKSRLVVFNYRNIGSEDKFPLGSLRLLMQHQHGNPGDAWCKSIISTKNKGRLNQPPLSKRTLPNKIIVQIWLTDNDEV